MYSSVTDYKIVKELISKTEKGLKTIVRLNLKDYPIGIKTDKTELDFSRIHFNQNIPELSYRIAALMVNLFFYHSPRIIFSVNKYAFNRVS